jgi:hypothetical protein
MDMGMVPQHSQIDPADVDHGCLPPWRTADLPEPLPFSPMNLLRTIGPGAILLAGAIGGGEWIVGPLMVVKYGPSILWVATLGICLQMLFNLEGIRYTLYTGEPILTGIMRLRPGPWFWGPIYIALGAAQMATPAIAVGCATVLFCGAHGTMPTADDAARLQAIAIGVILLAVLLLVSGKSIERLLEKLSWGMILFIFTFLIIVNVLCVSPQVWWETTWGFVRVQELPQEVNLVMLALFAATAGSGGLGNLTISNWFRDKGFGMGAHVGGIAGALSTEEHSLKEVGVTCPVTPENTRRWRTWWRYAVIDQQLLWGGGCLLGMFLNVNLAAGIMPRDVEVSGYAVGAFQAEALVARLGPALWWLTSLLDPFGQHRCPRADHHRHPVVCLAAVATVVVTGTLFQHPDHPDRMGGLRRAIRQRARPLQDSWNRRQPDHGLGSGTNLPRESTVPAARIPPPHLASNRPLKLRRRLRRHHARVAHRHDHEAVIAQRSCLTPVVDPRW